MKDIDLDGSQGRTQVFIFFPSAHSLVIPLLGPTVPQLVNSIVLLSYINRSENPQTLNNGVR